MYVCEYCGQESVKWMGKCPSCNQWGTMKEIRLTSASQKTKGVALLQKSHGDKAVPLHKIDADAEPRIDMGDGELNRVLGGGLVPGSLVLLGGEPGIGKSTLTLQTIVRLHGKRILYVSGEESARQIKLRADRLLKRGVTESAVREEDFSADTEVLEGEAEGVLVLCETSLEQIFQHIEEVQPDLVVIDSIQTIQTETVESSAGSLSQILILGFKGQS